MRRDFLRGGEEIGFVFPARNGDGGGNNALVHPNVKMILAICGNHGQTSRCFANFDEVNAEAHVV
jgi:hypothetical protein